MENGVVVCDKISKTYRTGSVRVPALKEVDLRIPRGQFVTLAGPSGSGKTTLLNLVGGLDRPTSGTVTLEGQRIDELTPSELADFRLGHVGFVFQAYNLLPVLTARENVELVMELRGVEAEERHELSHELLTEVGLGGMEDRRPAELSGGQQQRIAVARAIVAGPAIVLADEPTANLDSHTASDLVELMLGLSEKRGSTFLISTHDPLVMKLAPRRIHLRDGRIVEDRDGYGEPGEDGEGGSGDRRAVEDRSGG